LRKIFLILFSLSFLLVLSSLVSADRLNASEANITIDMVGTCVFDSFTVNTSWIFFENFDADVCTVWNNLTLVFESYNGTLDINFTTNNTLYYIDNVIVPPTTDFSVDLISYFPFNDTSNAQLTDIISGYNFTNHRGTPVPNISSINNNAFLFSDGGFYYDLDRQWFDGNISTDQNFTISIWVNNTGYSGADTFFANYGFDSGTPRVGMTFDQDTNYGGATSGGVFSSAWDGRTKVTDNTWAHIVWTKKGNNHSFYVNGVLDFNITGMNEIIWLPGNQNGAALTIGHFYAEKSTDQTFNGMIDELGYWNTSLTSTQVAELYNSGDGLFYPFNSLEVNWFNQEPLNNSVNNESLLEYFFNVTGLGIENVNCSIYWNGSLEETKNNLVANISHSFNITKNTGTAGNFTSFIECLGDNGLTTNSTTKYVYWNFTGERVTTNLTTDSVSWPSLNFSINVSLWNGGWNESPTCQIIDNVSWVTCSPSSSLIDLAVNESYFDCGASERNTGDVLFYANCSNSFVQNINSTKITKIITADSNPVVNLTAPGRVNESFELNLSFYNWTEDMTCGIVNNSIISCPQESFLSTDSEGNLSCTFPVGTEFEESIFVQCNSTLYEYINSSSSVIFADDVAPVITINSPNSSTDQKNNTAFLFDILIEDNNTFAVSLNCSIGGLPGTPGSTATFGYLEENINNASYRLLNTTTLSQVGLHQCIINVSDDHTGKTFEVDSGISNDKLLNILPLDQKKLKLIEGYVGDVDFTVKKENVPSLTTEIVHEGDRYSLKMKFDNPDKELKEVPVVFECPWKLYPRFTNPKYKEHWLCANGIEGYWIDGNTKNNDEVSTNYNELTNELTYLYKTTNDEIIMESIGGLNYNWSFFNITVDFWQNVTFAAHNIWNASNVDSFKVNITNSSGTVTQYTTTTGNITINLENGTYTILQFADDYAFGNLSSSFTVGDTSTYNSSFWQAELTVNVKELPSDILIPGVSLETNMSGIQNTTASASTGSITYYIDAGTYSSYTNHSASYFSPNAVGSSGTITLGEQKSITLNLTRSYNVIFKREETGELFNLSEDNETNITLRVRVLCENNETVTTVLTNPTTISGINCDWQSKTSGDIGWYITVTYPVAGESYFRYINPELSATNVTIYLLDLILDDAVYWQLTVNDLAGLYDVGEISILKDITGSLETVMTQRVDFSKEVQFWLDENERYVIHAKDDEGTISDLGYFIADAPTSETLSIPSIPLFDTNPNPQSEIYWQYTADRTAGSVSINISETSTISYTNFTWSLYELNMTGINNLTIVKDVDGNIVQTLIYNITLTAGGNSTETYTGLDGTKTYISVVNMVHPSMNYIINEPRIIWYGHKTTFEGFEEWDEDIKLWIAITVVLGLFMIFSIRTFEWGMGVALIITSIFMGIGWFDNIAATPAVSRAFMIVFLSLFAVLTIALLWKKEMKK